MGPEDEWFVRTCLTIYFVNGAEVVCNQHRFKHRDTVSMAGSRRLGDATGSPQDIVPVPSTTSSSKPVPMTAGSLELMPVSDELKNLQAGDQSTAKKSQGPTIGLMVSALPSLVTFSILGVMIRFGLEILLGPDIAGLTASNSPLFIDLPVNMVGCFFMGWVGSILKKEITDISPLLAIGLSTGLMGSITTFSSWNQSVISAITHGYVLQGICALFIGTKLAQMSFLDGMQTAKLLKKLAFHNDLPQRSSENRGYKVQCIFILASSLMWIGSAVLSILDVHNPTRRKLWMGCAVGPLGTWMRWFLSKLNGQGITIGSRPRFKWFPLGTFLANSVAVIAEAGMALYQCRTPDHSMKLLMESFQLGLAGCMSTVSSMILEMHSLREGSKPWRAQFYLFITIFSAMAFSFAIFSTPILILKAKHC